MVKNNRLKFRNMHKKSEDDDRKRILLMPIGTGICSKEEYKCLAAQLLFLIQKENPNQVIIFTSDEAKKTTLKSLRKQYEETIGRKFSKISTIINIKDSDDFNESFYKISRQVDSYKDCEVIIDYTSGSKAMTMAASIVATQKMKKLIFVDGPKNEKGNIIHGKEELKIQNLENVQDKVKLDKFKDLFNNNRFEAAHNEVYNLNMAKNEDKNSEIKILNYLFLSKTYAFWDKFNHDLAGKFFKTGYYQTFGSMKDQLKRNNKALNIINDSNNTNLKYLYILASMINNAKRRCGENKFDDAIARLYRALELISQIDLYRYGLNTSDINPMNIKKISPEAYNFIFPKLISDYQGKCTTRGLDNNYVLIHMLNHYDEVGIYYKENRTKIMRIISHRNNSILAHGLKNKTIKDYKAFEEIVIELALKLDENMVEYLKDTKFPKF